MKTLSQEQVALIKKPLPKEAVMPHPTKQNLSTIKAIYVTERFNDVFGIGGWTIKTDLIDNPLALVKNIKITKAGAERTEYTALMKTKFEAAEYGIYYECVASSVNDDIGDASKGAATDAITKIASYIGIGIDVFKGQHDKALTEYSNNIFTDDIKSSIDKCKTKEEVIALSKKMSDDVKSNKEFRLYVTKKLESCK
jgi:hypothetical protein